MTTVMKSVSIVDIERRDDPLKHYLYVTLVESAVGRWLILRRYNQFYEFQNKLLEAFPDAAGQNGNTRVLPSIPGKILFGRSQIKDVAKQRLHELNSYLEDLLKLPPEISESKIVENFFLQTSDDISACTATNARSGKTAARAVPVNISAPSAMPRATVCLPFTKSNPTEISVEVGQEVELIRRELNGWAQVRQDLQWGWVPVTCLQLVGSASGLPAVKEPPPRLQVVVRDIAEPPLRRGLLVCVKEFRDDGWWRLEGFPKQRVPAVCLAPLKGALLEPVLARLKPKSPPPRPSLPPSRERSPCPSPTSQSKPGLSSVSSENGLAPPPRPAAPARSPNSSPAPSPRLCRPVWLDRGGDLTPPRPVPRRSREASPVPRPRSGQRQLSSEDDPVTANINDLQPGSSDVKVSAGISVKERALLFNAHK